MCSLCKVYLRHNIKHKINSVIVLVETMVSPLNKSSNKRYRVMLTQENEDLDKKIREKSPIQKKMKGCEFVEDKLEDDTKAIYELIDKVENTKVITVIVCYMPVLRCAAEMMMNNTKESSKDWPNRREALLEDIRS